MLWEDPKLCQNFFSFFNPAINHARKSRIMSKYPDLDPKLCQKCFFSSNPAHILSLFHLAKKSSTWLGESRIFVAGWMVTFNCIWGAAKKYVFSGRTIKSKGGGVVKAGPLKKNFFWSSKKSSEKGWPLREAAIFNCIRNLELRIWIRLV